jgi:octaprenyl-diphosphate synthase
MLSQVGAAERRRIIRTIRNHHDNQVRVSGIIDRVNHSGGIAYAREKMLSYRAQALEMLATFPENDARRALEQLVIFTTERSK